MKSSTQKMTIGSTRFPSSLENILGKNKEQLYELKLLIWLLEYFQNINIGTRFVLLISRGVIRTLSNIRDTLRDLVTFAPFKKREKCPWISVAFSKVAGLKVALLYGCFSRS